MNATIKTLDFQKILKEYETACYEEGFEAGKQSMKQELKHKEQVIVRLENTIAQLRSGQKL